MNSNQSTPKGLIKKRMFQHFNKRARERFDESSKLTRDLNSIINEDLKTNNTRTKVLSQSDSKRVIVGIKWKKEKYVVVFDLQYNCVVTILSPKYPDVQQWMKFF